MAPSADRPNVARTQLYFVDACRTRITDDQEVNRADQLWGMGKVKIDDRNMAVFQAAAFGSEAYAIPNDTTVFSKALVECLSGLAGVNNTGDFDPAAPDDPLWSVIVAPSGRPSMASTRACFDPGRLSREEPALLFALPVCCLARTDVCVATEARLREATTLTADASTSVRSGAGPRVVSVGGPTATSLTPDRFEAPFGDAKRHRSSFRIASPGQERAIGADLFKQPSADELIHGLSNRFDRNVCRQVNPAIIATQSRGQNDELGIGESCHRDPPLRWCGVVRRTTTAPPRPCSRRGRIPRASRAR